MSAINKSVDLTSLQVKFREVPYSKPILTFITAIKKGRAKQTALPCGNDY